MDTLSRYCALVAFALIAATVWAQPTKIGYVNVLRIENESALAKQSLEVLKKEFGPREQQLAEMQKTGNALQADLEKNAATMPAAERIAKEKRITAMLQQYQQMQRSMAEDFEVRKRESFGGFLSEVNDDHQEHRRGRQIRPDNSAGGLQQRCDRYHRRSDERAGEARCQQIVHPPERSRVGITRRRNPPLPVLE